MTDETTINQRLQNTTDAAIWTDTFFELHGERLADIDWGLMVGWFANAIEVGREAGRSREAAKHPDTDTRCTHHDGAGQCLDHQGHQGEHQPPTPPLSVEYPCTECGHVASQHYDEPHPYDAGCRECVDCNGFVSEAPARSASAKT